jgi:hypothetical protein
LFTKYKLIKHQLIMTATNISLQFALDVTRYDSDSTNFDPKTLLAPHIIKSLATVKYAVQASRFSREDTKSVFKYQIQIHGPMQACYTVKQALLKANISQVY